MAAISKRLFAVALCSLGLLFSQGPQASAETYFEDFESGGPWPAANQHQCTIQSIGSFYYGWYGVGCVDCCTSFPGSYWAYSMEQAHSGTHSMKQKFPRNAPDIASMTRIHWPGEGINDTFTEVSYGGWFYIPATGFVDDWMKWIYARFVNDAVRTIVANCGAANGICFYMSLDGGSINARYPQGSPDQLKYYKLYPCNADGTMRYWPRGQWHHIKIYMKLVPAPAYTDTLKIWIDGEIVKLRYGTAQADMSSPGGNVVDANLTDIELSGDAVNLVNWNLNANRGVFDDADYYLYWDDIFVSNDFTPPSAPTAVSVP